MVNLYSQNPAIIIPYKSTNYIKNYPFIRALLTDPALLSVRIYKGDVTTPSYEREFSGKTGVTSDLTQPTTGIIPLFTSSQVSTHPYGVVDVSSGILSINNLPLDAETGYGEDFQTGQSVSIALSIGQITDEASATVDLNTDASAPTNLDNVLVQAGYRFEVTLPISRFEIFEQENFTTDYTLIHEVTNSTTPSGTIVLRDADDNTLTSPPADAQYDNIAHLPKGTPLVFR